MSRLPIRARLTLVFALAMAFVASSTLGAWGLMKDGIASQRMQEFLAAGAFIVGYVIIALGYSTIYQATVKLALFDAWAL